MTIFNTKVNIFNTFTTVAPTVASKPISEAPILCPDINTISSFSISHPWKTNFQIAFKISVDQTSIASLQNVYIFFLLDHDSEPKTEIQTNISIKEPC